MQTQTQTNDFQETFEYHGNTSVEMTRRELGYVTKRDWIIFDTVEEAQTFYYDHCSDGFIQ
jgi:hypothetical protein